jgi:replicative DNA helicase
MSTYPQIIGERERPTAIHAERTILGGMLLDEIHIEDATELLEADDFALDSHRRIFTAILAVREDGMAVDYTTVINELERRKEYDSIGGSGYLYSLTEGLPRKLSIESYVRIVKDKSRLRAYLAVTDLGQAEASDQSEEAGIVIPRTIERLQAIVDGAGNTRMERMGDYLNANYKQSDDVFLTNKKAMGVPSGWTRYDELTHGFHRQELTIVAGRPSMGKTAWVGSLIDNVGRAQGRRIAVFSLEQRKRSLMSRLLCGRAMASLQRFNAGESTPEERRYIADAMDEYRKAPIFWDGYSGMTGTEIRNKVRRLIREGGPLDLMILDQLSHEGYSDFFRKGMQRDEIQGNKALHLVHLGQEFDLPVVAMSQLTRTSTKNKDSKPTLADLAESGQLEGHADNVVFLHRPWYYDKSEDPMKGEIIVAKQRDGPTGSCMVSYLADACRWQDDPKASKETADLGATPW